MSTISDDQPVNGCVPWRETEVEGENQNEKMKCKICLHNISATPNPGWGGGGGVRREGLCLAVSFCRLRQPITVLQLWPELSLEGFTRNVCSCFFLNIRLVHALLTYSDFET